jgi:hypothetical protein
MPARLISENCRSGLGGIPPFADAADDDEVAPIGVIDNHYSRSEADIATQVVVGRDGWIPNPFPPATPLRTVRNLRISIHRTSPPMGPRSAPHTQLGSSWTKGAFFEVAPPQDFFKQPLENSRTKRFNQAKRGWCVTR